MDPDQEYRSALREIAGRIRDFTPSDIVERFASKSGFCAESYQRCLPEFDGTVCAVDGSNALILDAGSFTVAAVRASASSYAHGVRRCRTTTPLHVVAVHQRECNDDFESLFSGCFNSLPKAPLEYEDPLKNAAVIRDTLEYFVAMEMAEGLDAGDVIVLDGTLRVRHASHDEILIRLMNICNLRGILLAAVTKRTALTWGRGHPIVPAAEGLARRLQIAEPWYVCLSGMNDLLDRQESHLWKQRGDQYIARLHPRSQRAFKIEVPPRASPRTIERIFSALAAYADDGRVTGYPYPLLDAHLTTKIGQDAVEQIRQDLVKRMSELGMNLPDYLSIFGDYHDEFDRY
jgi:hypothetical protein